jgi:hypothetical protein
LIDCVVFPMQFGAHANIIVSIVALASFGFFVDPAIEKVKM